MLITRQNLDAVRVGFQSLYNRAMNACKPQWQEVAMEVNSTQSEENYGWLGTNTRFRKWLGERVVQNLKEHGYTIKNEDYENTIGVERNKIEDDSYGIYKPMFEQLGQDAAAHPDEKIFTLLKDGFSTPCYDGQNFFDTDHPVLDENGDVQSVSNSGGGSGAPWFLMDTSQPIKPLIFQKRKGYEFVSLDDPKDPNVFWQKLFIFGVDARVNAGYGLWQLAFGSKQALDETNYNAARVALTSMKGDNGRPLNIKPNLLVVGPSNETAAKKLVVAETVPTGGTNIHEGTARVVVVPWLA